MTEEMRASRTANGNYPITIDGKRFFAFPARIPEGNIGEGSYLVIDADLTQDQFEVLVRLFGAHAKVASIVGPNGVVAKQGVQIAIIPALASDNPDVIAEFERVLGAPGSKSLAEIALAGA